MLQGFQTESPCPKASLCYVKKWPFGGVPPATTVTSLEAMVHFDGTARHQSVGESDEPWLHELLLAVGKYTGLAALINTSFNSRGQVWGGSSISFEVQKFRTFQEGDMKKQ